jgi:tetratricopeptide (TPR) repeat protein
MQQIDRGVNKYLPKPVVIKQQLPSGGFAAAGKSADSLPFLLPSLSELIIPNRSQAMSTDPQIPPISKDQAKRLLDEGRALLRADRHSEALQVAERLLNDAGETPEVLLFAADVHFTRANFFESERLARRCREVFPDEFGGPILHSRALLGLRRMGEARELALGMADKDITDDSQLGVLVMVLTACMIPEAAYPLCKRAVERDPDNPQAQRRLALTCRLIGKLDEAMKAAEVALRGNRHDYEIIGLRSAVGTATKYDNHIAELEALLAEGVRNPLGGASVAYALAKECEEVGYYERGFGHLRTGAAFKRQTLNYRIEDELNTFRILQEILTEEALSNAGNGYESNEPIFILGLPRTGSTLVERIISSHSAVFAAGELRHFSAAMMEGIRKLGPSADSTDLARKSLQLDMHEVGRRYIEMTRPATGHTPHFIDKLPLNSLYIGNIHLALPNAKIIHLRRTPMDACYAIYKFLFNQAYSWSYDLVEIAQYYIAHRGLMDHWRSVLPGRIIDIAYEDVVEDLEGEAKHLIDVLGLEWEPACLQFHENVAAAMTGSAVQVRKKIYSSSVGRWRDYEKQLKPLAEALEAGGIDPYTP